MAKKLSKRMKAIREKVQPGRVFDALEALKTLKEIASVKFAESIDIAVNLGIDPRKMTVRGATLLPNGSGKSVRVAVFAQGDNAKLAQEAGADIVGFEDLADSIKAGNMDFDVVIATPDAMRIVGQLGQVLGPRGLMPNPKVGTVTPDVVGAIKRAKAGQVAFRVDKGGVIHCSVGIVNFTPEQLKQNMEAVLADIKKLRPSDAKGIYMKKLTISSTMGPGLVVDLSSVEV